MKKYVAAIDLGGTKTAIALYDEELNQISQRSLDTRRAESPEKLFADSATVINEMETAFGVRASAVGLCTPGPISVSEGKIVYIASLDWYDVPVVSMLEQALGRTVVFENDTNAAAYAERFAGAGRSLPKGYGNLVYVTVSTGVGAGIIVDDRIVHGSLDWAGEFGHIRLFPKGRPCSCGNDGCLEAYVSGTALEKQARNMFNDKSIDCLSLERMARSGDKTCLSIWSEMGSVLGHGLSILLQLFNPHLIVLGGGVTRAWDLFADSMREEMLLGVYNLVRERISIVRAELGQSSCEIGAAMLALKKL